MDHSFQRPTTRVASRPRHEDFGLSRRELLRLAAVATAVGLTGLPLSLSACGTANQHIRREITTAAAQTINSFKTAITKMIALPNTDPRNWTRQAQIHNDHCRHASWLFFPWHRAYLFYFEQICSELSGDATFALPYWNWTANPQIPAVFWDKSSPLFFSNRVATASSIASASSVGSAVVNPMLDEPNFLVFAGPATSLNDPNQFGPGYGLVEQTPHNYIHPFVGGGLHPSMGDFMSPLDPIFWTHHNRIDEMWVEWNILKDHPNTDDSTWWDTEFTDFCDGKGNPVTVSVAATVLMPFLSYKFDTQP